MCFYNYLINYHYHKSQVLQSDRQSHLSVLNQWSIESLGSNSLTQVPSPLSLIRVSTVLVFKADQTSYFHILCENCSLTLCTGYNKTSGNAIPFR